MPLYEFLSRIYIIYDIVKYFHMSNECSRLSHKCLSRIAQVQTLGMLILYNSSINKKLILSYILDTKIYIFAQFAKKKKKVTYKVTVEWFEEWMTH